MYDANLISEVLDRWIALKETLNESNRINGEGYNPLSDFIKINETTNSRIIGDLLNPQGSHGQGNIFLIPLLEFLEIPEPNVGLWRVTVETGRVDIAIWRNEPRSAIIIENKSNDAGDQPNQIYRYWYKEMFLWDKELWMSNKESDRVKRVKNYCCVYLPTESSKIPSSHSFERPVDWGIQNNEYRTVPQECVKILDLGRLMSIWNSRSIPAIHCENRRLINFFSLYQELWIK
jgi:hypothetical protein